LEKRVEMEKKLAKKSGRVCQATKTDKGFQIKVK
jgi:hypothetical protein